MILDYRTSEVPNDITADLIIIGGGAAGITLCREFIGRAQKVCLLEAGGLDYDEQSQDSYRGKNVGLPYFALEDCRLRYFGGSTNHWGGLCLKMEPADFTARPWMPYSGWPFTHEELMPFYGRAAAICEIGEPRFDESLWRDLDIQPPQFDKHKLFTRFGRDSPTRFGTHYREELRKAENVTIYLNANVTKFVTSAAGDHLESVEISTYQGKHGNAKGKFFVLATGGIENARLLLNSEVTPNGLGNSSGLLGRCFMEHAHVSSGLIASGPDAPIRVAFDKHPTNPGLNAFYAGWRAVNDRRFPDHPIGMAYNLIRHFETVVAALYGKVVYGEFGKFLDPDDLRSFNPHLALAPEVQEKEQVHDICATLWGRRTEMLDVLVRLEPRPNPDSRVFLDDERDRLGLRRAILDWRLTAEDRKTVAVFMRTLAAELGRLEAGRVKIEEWVLNPDSPWPSSLYAGNHHMGTTRMSRERDKGVVDADCRMHDVDNLYLGGSSVFPTAGFANPTFTIVSVSLRLAEHLKTEFG
jgi:choline dehydrogenase-like flavoprotein